MAFIQQRHIGFRNTSVPITVPDSDVARLMYYLNCVCQAIEYTDNDIDRYRAYRNWSSLSTEEVRVLLVLCLTFSPDVFNNRVFFQSDALCAGSQNKFYEISQIRHQVLVVQSIVVAGRTRQVNRIMAYQLSWMRNNYWNPIQRLAQRFDSRSQRSIAAAAHPNRTSQPSGTSQSNRTLQPSRTSICVIL